MSYRDFTLKEIERRFGLTIAEYPDLFAAAPEVAPAPRFQELLAGYIPLALDINTEKARSEWIIAPLLFELRSLLNRRISLFSGVEFNVAPGQGLNGVCDFLLSRSSTQLFISAPVAAITEAKNEDIKGGIAQCLAAMIGARLFNENEGRPIETIFGAVTTGTIWRFLRLEGESASIDQREYHVVERLAKILGIFVRMFPEGEPHTRTDQSPETGTPLAKES